MLRRLLVAALALVAALTLGSVAFVWAFSDEIMRWGGYSAAHERLVTGILVTGTPARPVIYVTSSDPRFGPGISRREDPVDTNSGVLSRLELTPDGWRRTDLVRGLPRSNADHAPNGMALSPDGTTLYIAQGSNTNEGAPAERFGYVPEYELSGAILAVDLLRIGERTYDLPTYDDPSREGVRDANDPFGGNGGANQARLVPGGPVQVHATGVRNPYDVVVTRAGRLYTIQNGPNTGYGGRPVGEGTGSRCTNEPREGGRRAADTLHLVEPGGYYGHPNPTRQECDYLEPRERESLALFSASTNGLAEYGGGDLIAASLGGQVLRLRLSDDGRRMVKREVLAAELPQPLDVTVQADGDAFPGTIWVAQYGAERGSPIAVLEPVGTEPTGWSALPSTGLARQEVSFVEAGGSLYLAGGGTQQQVFDPASNRWHDVAPLPEKLDHIQGVAVGGRIFYIGGLRDWPEPHVSSVHVYDPSTDRFSRGAPMPRGRGAGGGAAHEGKIYYAGGLHDGEAVPWLDVYDPATDTWSRLPDMPRARDHFQAVVSGGKLYAIGGRQGPLGSELSETDRYDFATGTWESGLALLPTPRGGFAAAALGGRIYVIGGETPEGALGTMEAYDPQTDTWETMDPMPTARHGIQAAVGPGGIYVAAGGATAGGDDPVAAFESYVPQAGSPSDRFTRTFLRDAVLESPTSLQFGPDGRLYAAQQNGLLKVFTVVRRSGYEVTSTEEIDLIQDIPNHDDDGSSATDFDATVRVLWQKLGP
ncbi:MAG TPA: kelch repeat-containing protein [Gaiellaceae bacterium]|nr:kelch repeat-containing protein [Gaiellaceae bacterium]